MPAIFNLADIVKIGIISFIVIKAVSHGLKSAGLDQYIP